MFTECLLLCWAPSNKAHKYACSQVAYLEAGLFSSKGLLKLVQLAGVIQMHPWTSPANFTPLVEVTAFQMDS
jgi:hypothetical protein